MVNAEDDQSLDDFQPPTKRFKTANTVVGNIEGFISQQLFSFLVPGIIPYRQH